MRVKLGERRVKEGKRGRGREGTIEMGERGGVILQINFFSHSGLGSI